jgi:hypothetical protein
LPTIPEGTDLAPVVKALKDTEVTLNEGLKKANDALAEAKKGGVEADI